MWRWRRILQRCDGECSAPSTNHHRWSLQRMVLLGTPIGQAWPQRCFHRSSHRRTSMHGSEHRPSHGRWLCRLRHRNSTVPVALDNRFEASREGVRPCRAKCTPVQFRTTVLRRRPFVQLHSQPCGGWWPEASYRICKSRTWKCGLLQKMVTKGHEPMLTWRECGCLHGTDHGR